MADGVPDCKDSSAVDHQNLKEHLVMLPGPKPSPLIFMEQFKDFWWSWLLLQNLQPGHAEGVH